MVLMEKKRVEIPFQMSGIKIDPVLEAFKGWNMDTTQMREASVLTKNHA